MNTNLTCKALMLLTIATTYSNVAVAQDVEKTSDKDLLIETSPIAVLAPIADLYWVPVTVTKAVSKHQAYGAEINYFQLDKYDIEARGFSFAPTARYYFQDATGHSAFLQGQLGYSHAWIDSDNSQVVLEENDISAINATAMAGYKWQWDSGFSMNLAGGAAYSHVLSDFKVYDEDGDQVNVGNKSSFGPALQFNLGWAF